MSPSRLLIPAALASACGYAALAAQGDLRPRPGFYLGVHAALFAVYLAAIWLSRRAPQSLRLVLGAALLFRLILLPSAPALSDDIHRYVWEGGVQRHGINPYLHAPADPELSFLRDGIYEQINNKELPAIYPPLAQWVFAAAALVSRTTLMMKGVMIAADVGLILVVARLLKARGRPGIGVLIYAWNPLAVVEVAGSGHNDPLALLLLVAATVGIIGQRPLLSMTAAAGAALGKLFPILLVPLLAAKVRARWWAVPPLLMAACYLPYASAGARLLESPVQFAERWRGNESLFAVIEAAVKATGAPERAKSWADARGWPSLYAQPHMLARGLAGLIVLGALVALTRRVAGGRLEPERAIFLATGAALLLQPIVHPWYLLWILPWLCLIVSPAWIVLTGLAPLAYAEPAWGGWVRWAEYAPFFALLAAGPVRRLVGSYGRVPVERRPEQ